MRSVDRLSRRILTVAVVALLGLSPAVPALASGEDTKAKKAETEKSEPQKEATSEKKTEDTPQAAPTQAAPAEATTAAATDAEACKPTMKFNTFEDLFGGRVWNPALATTAAPASAADTTVAWREATPQKPAAPAKPEAAEKSKKVEKD